MKTLLNNGEKCTYISHFTSSYQKLITNMIRTDKIIVTVLVISSTEGI